MSLIEKIAQRSPRLSRQSFSVPRTLETRPLPRSNQPRIASSHQVGGQPGDVRPKKVRPLDDPNQYYTYIPERDQPYWYKLHHGQMPVIPGTGPYPPDKKDNKYMRPLPPEQRGLRGVPSQQVPPSPIRQSPSPIRQSPSSVQQVQQRPPQPQVQRPPQPIQNNRQHRVNPNVRVPFGSNGGTLIYDGKEPVDPFAKQGNYRYPMLKLALGLANDNIDTPSKYDKREAARAVRVVINSENDAVTLYEAIGDAYPKIKGRMQHIAEEEKRHIGELMEILKDLDPTSEKELRVGRKEVEDDE